MGATFILLYYRIWMILPPQFCTFHYCQRSFLTFKLFFIWVIIWIFLFFLKFIFFELRFSLTIHSIIKIMKIKCRSTSNNYWGIFRKETSDVRLRSATSWYNNQNITVIVSENTLRHLKCVFFVLGNSFTLIKWKFYNIEDRKNGSVFRFNKLNL